MQAVCSKSNKDSPFSVCGQRDVPIILQVELLKGNYPMAHRKAQETLDEEMGQLLVQQLITFIEKSPILKRFIKGL